MSPTRCIIILLAMLSLAMAARAQKPVAEGGFYVGRLDGGDVTIELRRYSTRRGPYFECIVDGAGYGRYKLQGPYSRGRYEVSYISLDNREMPRGAGAAFASLAIGAREGEIRGTLPDSTGSVRLSFSGTRMATTYRLTRALPNDGYAAVSYPHIVTGASRLRNAINAMIDSYVTAHLRSIEADAKGGGPEGGPDNTEISSDLNLSIYTFSPPLITFFAAHDIRYNGGHSFNDYEGLNYLIEGDTIRRIMLRDLFLPGSGYLGRLRQLVAARADSLARITYAESPEIFEVEEEPIDSAELARRLDTLGEGDDYLVSFRIVPGGLAFHALCGARYPIYEDVWIDLEEVRDMIDPKGLLARFLTKNPPTDH